MGYLIPVSQLTVISVYALPITFIISLLEQRGRIFLLAPGRMIYSPAGKATLNSPFSSELNFLITCVPSAVVTSSAVEYNLSAHCGSGGFLTTGQVGPRRTVPFIPPVILAAGQGANSQLGPVRPTAEPSGQIFASCVQAVGFGSPLGKTRYW